MSQRQPGGTKRTPCRCHRSHTFTIVGVLGRRLFGSRHSVLRSRARAIVHQGNFATECPQTDVRGGPQSALPVLRPALGQGLTAGQFRPVRVAVGPGRATWSRLPAQSTRHPLPSWYNELPR